MIGLAFPIDGQRFTALEEQNSTHNAKYSQHRTHADDLENRSAVLRGRRVILIAIEQNVIDRRADSTRGSIDQTETHIAAGVLNPIKVTGNAAIRGKQHDTTGVSEQIRLCVKGEAEIRGLGHSFNRLLRAREEVPSGFRAGAAKEGQRLFLFFGGHLGSLAEIKADKDNFVVAAGSKREHSEHADDTLLDLVTEHGTTVVHEGEHDGSVPAIIT